MRRLQIFKTVLFIIVIAILPLITAELFLRIALYSDIFKIERLKDPNLYADPSTDDDFWKLYHINSGPDKSPDKRRVHPLLGWSQYYVTEKNPLGLWQRNLDLMNSSWRKILFYGDSFVMGASDPKFALPHYLTSKLSDAVVVDLSAGGYGLDQIYLMFTLTHEKVLNPYMIFGVFVNDDLDRSILSVRAGQKPYFVPQEGKLELKGVPINPDPQHFFETHPPEIKSYLYRLLYRRLIKNNTQQKAKLMKTDKKIEVSRLVIEKIAAECRKNGYPFLFVLFYTEKGLSEKSWQEVAIKHILKKNSIKYIDTRTVLDNYAKKHSIEPSMFYKQTGVGAKHHNNLGNKVIGDALLLYLTTTGS